MEESASNKVFELGSKIVETFRLCHISDLHFSKIVGRYNSLEGANGVREKTDAILRELLSAKGSVKRALYPSTFNKDVALQLLRQVVDESHRSDLVVVTGDIATTGIREDLSVGLEYFRGRLHSKWCPGYPELSVSLLENAVIFLPGNHDRYDGLALGPGSGEFEEVFGALWDRECGVNYDLHCVKGRSRIKVCTLEKDGAGLVIVSADLSLTHQNEGVGMFGYVGQGSAQLIEQMLDATKTTLQEAESARIPVAVVWAVHFPPIFPGLKPELKLLNEAEFVSAAESVGVQVIMAGHTHEALCYTVGQSSSVNVVCCGSSCGMSASEEYSYNMIEIDVGLKDAQVSLRVQTKRWSDEVMQFV